MPQISPDLRFFYACYFYIIILKHDVLTLVT